MLKESDNSESDVRICVVYNYCIYPAHEFEMSRDAY